MDRIGFYVDGKFFAGRHAQATSFAQFRANEFGREVEVKYVDHTKTVSTVDVVVPQQKVA